MCKKSTGWLFQPLRPRVHERTAVDRTDGPDAKLPSFSGRPRLAGFSLSRPSLRLTKEETSCGSGSIFRVRRCNKKQSSQRGVDRRWHGRPRRARRVGDRLSALSLDARFFIYSSSPFAFSVYRHDSFDCHLYQQICQWPLFCVLRDLQRCFFFNKVIFYLYKRKSVYAMFVRCFIYSVCDLD